MAPSRALFTLVAFLLPLTTAVNRYNDEVCCQRALETNSFVDPIPQVIICGQSYNESIDPAPNLYITYDFCTSECGGFGLSRGDHPGQWAAPIVQFLLPSVIFSMSIPRRFIFCSTDFLQEKLAKRDDIHLVLKMLGSLLLTLPSLCLVTVDTIIWVITIMGTASIMMVAGLHEALLDHKILKALEKKTHLPRRDNSDGDSVTSGSLKKGARVQARAADHDNDAGENLRDTVELLVTVVSGNLELKGAIPPNTAITNALLASVNRQAREIAPHPTRQANANTTGIKETNGSSPIAATNGSANDQDQITAAPPIYPSNQPTYELGDLKTVDRSNGATGNTRPIQPDSPPDYNAREVQDVDVDEAAYGVHRQPVISEQLKRLMTAQSAFGAIVGAPVVFYLGAFIYTILDLMNKPSDQDAAISLAFGVEWMIIVHVAIVSGCLLASNNPSPATMLVGIAPAAAPNVSPGKWHRRLFPPVYDGVFQPVFMWRRGINKREWLLRSAAWQRKHPEFIKDVTLSYWDCCLGIILPTIVLISLPPAAGAFVAWQTPPIGWSCRSLSFVVYAAFQLILMPLYYFAVVAGRAQPEGPLRWGFEKSQLKGIVHWLFRKFFVTLVILVFALSLFTSVGTTMMQIMGVYRNCLCYVTTEYWLNLRNATVGVASDTELQRKSAHNWVVMGGVATGFMVFCSFIGWWFQTSIRFRYEKVLRTLQA